MTDRELLELAAKAAFSDCANLKYPLDWVRDRVGDWSPLTDDGDALRLAVKLRIDVCHNHSADHQLWVLAERAGVEGCFAPACCVEDEFEESGRGIATRRAIVRAAAEIGRGME